jgi:hypothetical protein
MFSILASAGIYAENPKAGLLIPNFLHGDWYGTDTVFGIRPTMHYNSDFTYESGLITMTGKKHLVSKGTYSVNGNTITEVTTFVASGFYGHSSRIEAGKTIIHVTILPDGSIRSEDNPRGGKVIFKKHG